jgi:hypothetical protein
MVFSLSKIHDHTQNSSGLVISSSQIPLFDNTQHSQETDTHVPGEIRTRNPRKPTGGACRAYEEEERRIQGFGGET